MVSTPYGGSIVLQFHFILSICISFSRELVPMSLVVFDVALGFLCLLCWHFSLISFSDWLSWHQLLALLASINWLFWHLLADVIDEVLSVFLCCHLLTIFLCQTCSVFGLFCRFSFIVIQDFNTFGGGSLMSSGSWVLSASLFFSFVARTCSVATCLHLASGTSLILCHSAFSCRTCSVTRSSSLPRTATFRGLAFLSCRLGIIPLIILHFPIGIHRIGCSEGVFSFGNSTSNCMLLLFGSQPNRSFCLPLSGGLYCCLDVPYNECRLALRHSREFLYQMMEIRV